MKYEDILKVDTNYYTDYNGGIHILEKNNIYFIYMEAIELDQLYYRLSHVDNPEKVIEIKNISSNFLYLEKNKKYTLKITDPKLKIMLKLSRNTISSEVIISEKNIKLNLENLYYEMDAEQVQLEIKNENAFIEIHYKEDNIDIIKLEDLIGQSNLELNKTYNLITIPKEYTKKKLHLNLMT
jgi:hypothetical protein